MSIREELAVASNVQMDPVVKEKWLAALRSGEYTQTSTSLRRIVKVLYGEQLPEDQQYVGHCCLGVLCDISGLSEWHEPSVVGEYNYLGTYGMPPDDVVEWAGMDPRWALTQHALGHLASMNDDGKTFEEIAQWIEENL